MNRSPNHINKQRKEKKERNEDNFLSDRHVGPFLLQNEVVKRAFYIVIFEIRIFHDKHFFFPSYITRPPNESIAFCIEIRPNRIFEKAVNECMKILNISFDNGLPI